MIMVKVMILLLPFLAFVIIMGIIFIFGTIVVVKMIIITIICNMVTVTVILLSNIALYLLLLKYQFLSLISFSIFLITRVMSIAI